MQVLLTEEEYNNLLDKRLKVLNEGLNEALRKFQRGLDPRWSGDIALSHFIRDVKDAIDLATKK